MEDSFEVEEDRGRGLEASDWNGPSDPVPQRKSQPTLMAQLVELQEENARLREDAERWRLVVSHWTAADIRYNKDGSFKSLSIHAASKQISDEANIEKLNRAVDSARNEQK